MVLSEARFSSTLSTFLPRPIASLLGIRRVSSHTITVLDWNADLMGLLIPGSCTILPQKQDILGDPLIIQNGSRSTVARCQRIGQGNNWQCLLENTGREIARSQDGNLHFSTDLSFQLKLLLIAALTRVAGVTARVQGGAGSGSCLPFR